MKTVPYDTHVHSAFSNDGCEKLSDIYSAACAAGLSSVAVTDHYDIDVMASGIDEQVLSDGYTELREFCDKTVGDKTEMLCGIELGAAVFDTEKAKEIINSHRYDIVISSLHGILGKPEYYQLNYKEMSPDEIAETLLEYFIKLLSQAKTTDFDVLAHLDYPTRYLRRLHIGYQLKPFYGVLNDISKTLIERGKALEINTSGLRDVFHETQPTIYAVKRFKELGGEYITIGSDAHKCSDIASGFDYACAIAKQAGFKYITYYKNRKPVQIKIDL